MKRFVGFEHGMGIGGWLTNYKRFNVLPEERRMCLTVGDFEHFRSYITEKDVQYISSLGVDHIRLGFDQIVAEEKPGVYREEILCLMESFLSWCQKAGLSVVLNLHKAVGNYCDIKEDVELLSDESLQERFIALWLHLEERFKNYPKVAFELLNEVRDVEPDAWNSLCERTIRALRCRNRERILIVGSTAWNSPRTLKYLATYDDENVVYTFHTYEPFEFTHQQGVLQAQTLYYNRRMPYPSDIERYRDYQLTVNGVENAYADYDVMDKRFIADTLRPALDFIKEKPDKILWCGEFGTIRHADLRWRTAWMRDVIDFLKENGIPYCVWNYLSTPNDGNRFSLVDDDTRRILSEDLARIIRGEL